MDNKYFERFLVKALIAEKKKDDVIYNCVWRAHRDVLTARFYFKNYLKQNKNHLILKYLAEQIKLCEKPISSKPLINKLNRQFDVEFGAIQKLVNMTLKYLMIMDKYTDFQIDIDVLNCDCPLDSIILHKLDRDEIKWTSINEDKYNEIQMLISKKEEAKEGNIAFDFTNW